MANLYIPLTDRKLLSIKGDDAKSFLQGLITNDIYKLTADNAIYALMLNPQGRFLYEFFIYEYEGAILLDCNAQKLDEIKKKFSMYKLRSKVVIQDVSDKLGVVALSLRERADSSNFSLQKLVRNSGEGDCINQFSFPPHHNTLPQGEGTFTDPRSPLLPARLVMPQPADYSALQGNGYTEGSIDDYEKIRISFGIPSDKDMEYDKSFPLEFEMDKHNAIDYKKGCYVGQEITARTHYRGVVRKKPYIVKAEDSTDLVGYKGIEITSAEGAKLGVMCSSSGNTGLALLRTEDLEKAVSIEVNRIKLGIIPGMAGFVTQS